MALFEDNPQSCGFMSNYPIRHAMRTTKLDSQRDRRIKLCVTHTVSQKRKTIGTKRKLRAVKTYYPNVNRSKHPGVFLAFGKHINRKKILLPGYDQFSSIDPDTNKTDSTEYVIQPTLFAYEPPKTLTREHFIKQT